MELDHLFSLSLLILSIVPSPHFTLLSHNLLIISFIHYFNPILNFFLILLILSLLSLFFWLFFILILILEQLMQAL